VIIKIELAEPWNTSAVVPAELDRGWAHQGRVMIIVAPEDAGHCPSEAKAKSWL